MKTAIITLLANLLFITQISGASLNKAARAMNPQQEAALEKLGSNLVAQEFKDIEDTSNMAMNAEVMISEAQMIHNHLATLEAAHAFDGSPGASAVEAELLAEEFVALEAGANMAANAILSEIEAQLIQDELAAVESGQNLSDLPDIALIETELLGEYLLSLEETAKLKASADIIMLETNLLEEELRTLEDDTNIGSAPALEIGVVEQIQAGQIAQSALALEYEATRQKADILRHRLSDIYAIDGKHQQM